MLIKQYKPFIDNKEALYLKKVVSKTFLTENIETKKFEKNFSKKFNARNSLSISNWTVGLFVILKAINLKRQDEVIIPNITFFATASPIILCGAKVVLCDIDSKNLSLDLDDLEKKITKNTKCIIPVHLFGLCCDLFRLKKICKKNNIFLIEDSAQALGSKYKNNFLGNYGDFSGFSFYGNKIITTGEGAMIVFKNKKYFNKLYSYKNHGRIKKGIFKHDYFGLNFMFTEMQSAIGNIQLKKFDKILKKKIFINKFYRKELKNIFYLSFPEPIQGNKPNYWMTCIFVEKNKAKLKRFLHENNIETRDMFYPLNLQPSLKKKIFIKNYKQSFNHSSEVFKKSLLLPSGHELKVKELRYICDKIKLFFCKGKYKLKK